MILRVLGAAAGGGLPQWNCACVNCTAARTGQLPRMTQSSVAVSVSGETWVVLNASPDIRAQLADAFPPPALRGSPVKAVVLTNADVDHIAGLLTLREGTPFDLFAARETLDVLAANAVFGVMDPAKVARREIVLDQPFEPLPGLTVTAFAVPGKVALFLEGAQGAGWRTGGQTVGLRLAAGGRVVHYLPGCAEVPDWLLDRMQDSDLLLFDGTVWRDDEMAVTGTGQKTGGRMGHMAMSGDAGSLARLGALRTGRRAYIHINNTNPVLRDGPERAAVHAAGWTLAQDGMEFRL